MPLGRRSATLLSLLTGLTLGVVAATLPARADTVNVLWYTGGVEATSAGSYQAAANALATPGTGDPSTATWNITYWASGAVPVGTFNVLVVASPQGGWSQNPDYSALNAAAPGLTFGSRLMATGQDADWHNIFGPGSTNFNGPRGFLRDAINWAGNGTGLGLVMLGGAFTDHFASLGSSSGATDNVIIPGPVASFPINTGLTSAGLSNWSTSSHDIWLDPDLTIWTGINTDGGDGFVTLVTGGGLGDIAGAETPIPAALPLFASGAGVLGFLGWRRKKKAAALAA